MIRRDRPLSEHFLVLVIDPQPRVSSFVMRGIDSDPNMSVSRRTLESNFFYYDVMHAIFYSVLVSYTPKFPGFVTSLLMAANNILLTPLLFLAGA